MFKVFIDKEVLSYVEGLPTEIQYICFKNLKGIQNWGLTFVLCGDVAFFANNNFKIKCLVKNKGAEIHTGLILHGVFKENKDGGVSYSFYRAAAYIEGRLINAPWKKRDFEAVQLTSDFLEKKANHAFIQEGKENFKAGEYLLFQRRHKNHFFKDLQTVQHYWEHHKKFNSMMCFLGASKENVKEYVRLKDEGNLETTIKRFKRKYSEPYIIVNFIDKLNRHSHAQLEFFALFADAAQFASASADIIVIDVCVRDKSGKEHFQKEFKKYYDQAPESWGNAPAAFSMVIFRPSAKWRGEKYRKFKTLYLNLFEGCREEDVSEKEKNRRFLRNRNLIIHELYAALYCCSSQYIIATKDMRGKSKQAVDDMISTLALDSVVVRVNGGENIRKRAFKNLSLGKGYPFITIVKADGDPDIAEVYSPSSKRSLDGTKISINDSSDIRDEVEVRYEFSILLQLPGNQTVEKLYSYPELYMPKFLKESLGRRQYIPSVIGGKVRSMVKS